MSLPRIVTPDRQRLGDAIYDKDVAAVRAALAPVVASCDSWALRARLAQSVDALRDRGAIDECVAAAAILDLSMDESELLHTAVLAATAIEAGVADTPSGLMVAAG